MKADRRFAIGSYCSSRAWGGLEMNVLRLLKWMRLRGWPVYLYARPDSAVYERSSEYGVAARPVTVPSKLSALWHGRRLAKAVADDGVRFLIMNQSHDLLMSVMTKTNRRSDLGLIYCQHMHIAGSKRGLAHAWQFRQIDAFVSPAPWLARWVKERTVLAESDIHIIPLGIDLQQFERLPDPNAARRELHLPLQVPMLGVVGRLDPKKGQHVAIKALRKLHDSANQAHLLIVGAQTLHEATGYERQLRELVRELDLTDFVHFRPHLEQPERAYAAMDVFVLTSECESYGMVTIEAMCAGIPVIGTDDGGTTDIIAHERTGLRFPPNDSGGLAASVTRYLEDPEFADRLASEGRRVGRKQYCHHVQTASWEKLFDHLLEA